MIECEVSNGRWKGIRLPRGVLTLSHLFFADDLILSGTTDNETCHTISQVLGDFCTLSGHRLI